MCCIIFWIGIFFSGISFFNYESENCEREICYFFSLFFYFISLFSIRILLGLALEFNINERNKWFSLFSHFLLQRWGKGREEKKGWNFLIFNERNNPSPPSSNKFQRGEKKEIVGVQINRDWDSKVLENSYDSLKSTLSTRFTFHVLKKEQVYQLTFCHASRMKKNLLLELILFLLSFLLWRQNKKIKYTRISSYRMAKMKGKTKFRRSEE